MISRNDDLGERQPLQEGARFQKLAAARPLRQVAGYSHEVRLQFPDGSHQRLD
jgi:hypothetical protein